MTKVVDDNNMIIKPCVYGRSNTDYKVGDKGSFRSSGWKIEGKVQSIHSRADEDGNFLKMFIYLIEEVEYKEFIGLERTDEEEELYQKELERKRQLKFKL